MERTTLILVQSLPGISRWFEVEKREVVSKTDGSAYHGLVYFLDHLMNYFKILSNGFEQVLKLATQNALPNVLICLVPLILKSDVKNQYCHSFNH